MSEEKKVFCTECGAENSSNSKFCNNCGTKLEAASATETVPVSESSTDTVYSDTTPYSSETVVEETPVEDIQISYEQTDNGSYSSTAYDSQPQYYAVDPAVDKVSGGNKGFAIASMVCGILSVVCCCLGCFSLVLALVAIGLGIVTLACKYDGKGMAIAGIVLGGLGVVCFIVTICIGASEGYSEMMDEIMSELY